MRKDGILRIGTRASRLAEWQAQWVANQLREHYPDLQLELVRVKTSGDRNHSLPLATIGAVGLFTKEIQRALIDGTVDIAVHSLKDLPTTCPTDLVIAAVPGRETVSDALIAPVQQTLDKMPLGARVGTGSLRRQAQIHHAYPNLSVIPVRGNVETRVNLALAGKVDGVVLASAGLKRLNMDHLITQFLEPPDFLPAVGQGALAIECRRSDEQTQTALQVLNCSETHCAIRAERAALNELQGGCSVPMGVWARIISSVDGHKLLALDAAVFDPLGQTRLRCSRQGPLSDPVSLGREVAAALLVQGADRLLQQCRLL